MIIVDHLRVEYADKVVLSDVNATIDDGEVIAVIGSSGAGKSTLARCVNQLDQPTSGSVIIDGVNVTANAKARRKVIPKTGMTFQTDALFSNLTILDNTTLGQIEVLKRPPEEAKAYGMQWLERLALDEEANRYPHEISGGQRRRAAIARTLAMDPTIISFDEPTESLDPVLTNELAFIIGELARKGCSILLITHDMEFARRVATRVFYMDQGVIFEEGTPDKIFTNPTRTRTKAFINQWRTFTRAIKCGDFDFDQFTYAIDDFCRRIGFPARKIVASRHLFEEVFLQCIIKTRSVGDIVDFSLYYDAVGDFRKMSFDYDGERFDPMEHMDELSLAFVEHHAIRIQFEYWDKNQFRTEF